MMVNDGCLGHSWAIATDGYRMMCFVGGRQEQHVLAAGSLPHPPPLPWGGAWLGSFHGSMAAAARDP